ncbi:hypothetical protein KP509_37G050300 [Ceratopteris richardii]|uniref:Protein transport protein SEC23 n=1 Tax=Ceratopteris richardii TaxID=49495 RepID=A0A8T2Q8U4_CERRI|nr:hypothetical protein KP509_37G050300 [Ceratopteris richardii]
MEFAELEASEGLRWVWNTWPCSRKHADEMAIPLAILCCPLFPIPDLSLLPYAPLACAACHAFLNPYARFDASAEVWTCPFCFRLNSFPPSYHHHPRQLHSLPSELFPAHTCVEYVLPPKTGHYSIAYPQSPLRSSAPAFLFLLDVSIPREELDSLKSALLQTLSLLPDHALVGLISFGSQVHLHDLSVKNTCMKSIVFHGERELSIQKVQELLDICCKSQKDPRLQGEINQFLSPLMDCAFSLTAAIEEVQPYSVPSTSKSRPERSTGTALTVAISLLKRCVPNTGSRILLFVGGPCTSGPGKVVGTSFEENIRTHRDITNNRAHHTYKGEKFYKNIEAALIANGCVLDMFACSLDQVGIYEASSAINASGGILVVAETFGSGEFKVSLQRLFACDSDGCLKMCFNATVEVKSTEKVKVYGALGPCSPSNTMVSSLGNNQIGAGKTDSWRFCTLNENTHVAFLFEVSSHSLASSQPRMPFIMQFITRFQKSNGQMHVRVLTTARRWADFSQTEQIISGFDQEAAAAIVSRVAINKALKEDGGEVIRWLDNLLIRFASRFGDYNREDPESFSLSSNLSHFPQLMFYLRRSQFLQVNRNTPDETAFLRLVLNRESVSRTIIMIRPTLLSYKLDGPPVPVPLDISSVKADCILLFDSFFYVVVHYGLTIVQWRKLGYHKDSCHENFRKMLEISVIDAQSLLAERNPLPRFIECDQYSSQARFLLAKLNPSITHKTDHVGDSNFIFTDDISLEVFLSHLQELAVREDSYV